MSEPARSLSRLSARAFAGILGFCLLVFLFVNGPIWERRWEPDSSIVLSYAPIPFLVLLALLWEKKASLGALVVESLRLALVKFGITSLVLVALWSFSTPPKRPARALVDVARSVEAPPSPTTTSRGDLTGRLRDERGAPVSGALVFLDDPGLVGPAPRTPFELELRGGKILPALSAVTVGQPMIVRSGDGRVHTLRILSRGGDSLLNVAVLSSGAPRTASVTRSAGLAAASCAVHDEESASVLVLSHPWVATTDADGLFALRGVPAGAHTVSAWKPPGPAASREVTVRAGEGVEVDLVQRIQRTQRMAPEAR